MINCLLTGVGGQGTVLASKLISQCAMDTGFCVRTAETIGMAQRGGSVVSHVRIGETFSPLIPFLSADIIIAFEPAEAVRVLPYLKEGGTVIVSDKAIQPVSASLSGKGYDVITMLDFLKENAGQVVVLDANNIAKECGSSKVLNVALIGAAVASGKLNIDEGQMLCTIKKVIPEKFMDMNILAFKLGMGE